MSYSFNVRISREYSQISQWVESIKGKIVLAVQHDADEEVSRTHTHILIVESPVTALALKHRLEYTYKEDKFTKGDWAFPKLKDDDYRHISVYYSKGNLDPMFSKGLEYDWNEIKAEWSEPVKTQTQLNKDGKIIKLDKMKQSEMIDRITLLLKEDNDYSLDNCLTKVRKVFITENKCIVGRYKTRDIIDTLMAINQPNDWKCSLKRFCEYKT